MILKELLKLIENDDEFIPEVSEHEIYCMPNSVFKITLSPMCEEETWLNCNIQNEILIPWYDCEVTSIHPDDDNKNSICVWLKDEEYLMQNFKHCLVVDETRE